MDMGVRVPHPPHFIMQKEERYQIVKPYFKLNGTDLNGHVIEICNVKRCAKICSCRDADCDHRHSCDDKEIIFRLATSIDMKLEFKECIRDLQNVVRPVILKPDNVFEALL